MKFLKQLKIALLDFTSRNKIYKKQGSLTDADGLHRFIYSSNQFSKVREIIKPSGLMPQKGELSTFMCDDLSLNEKLKLSSCKIRSDKEPKCIGTFIVRDIKTISLGVCKKEWPHRHKNIIKWIETEEKAELKSQAQQLAAVMGDFKIVS